jgi:hypothetical protein
LSAPPDVEENQSSTANLSLAQLRWNSAGLNEVGKTADRARRGGVTPFKLYHNAHP